MTTRNVERVSLPILLCGERREPGARPLIMEYDSGLEVALYRPTADDARRIAASDRRALQALSIDDITIFFDQVAAAWRQPDNRWRRIAIELGTRMTGYARPMIEADCNLLATTLERAHQYDFIEADLGDPMLLDDWTRTKAIYTRCWPRGLIAHVMVGNVPMAALFTIYRSLVTKNVTATKLPKRDVATALAFANCIFDTDPDHPVTRALSTLYWEPGSDVEGIILGAADAVSVWGRGPTLESVRNRLPHNTDLIDFGPKRSLAVLLDGISDWDRCGMRIAFDVMAYDQEACFSVQEVFSLAGAEQLISPLSKWLTLYGLGVPRRPLGPDGEVHVHRARNEAMAEGWRVITPEGGGTGWTIVVTDGPAKLREHPLSRFIYVHPVKDVGQIVEHIDRDVQTVSVEPFERIWEVADRLTGAGADRIVQIGRHSKIRPGAVHDGFHPMRRMVRFASIERGVKLKYRFLSEPAEVIERRLYERIVEPYRDQIEREWATRGK